MTREPKHIPFVAKDFVEKTKGGEIPVDENLEQGLCGTRAPASYRQEGDIRDRLKAAGKLKNDKEIIPFVVR